MQILESIFYIIIEMSVIASIIGIITLLLKNILKTKIPPKWLFALWVVFLVTLINPFRLQSRFSIYNLISYESIAQKVGESNQTINNKLGNIHSNISHGANYKNISNVMNNSNKKDIDFTSYFTVENVMKVVVGVFFIVIIVKSIVSGLTEIKFRKATKENFDDERLQKILEKCKNSLGISKDIKIIKQEITATPAIYGIFNTKILLSENILDFSDDEIELIIMHELSHLKNGDIFLNKIIQTLKTIYWFNPIVLLALKRIKKDIELVNDENVIGKSNDDKAKLYCKTLLKVSLLSNNEICFALGMNSRADELEERIKMIKYEKKFFKNPLFICSIMLIIILSITVCFATAKISDAYIEGTEISGELLQDIEADNTDLMQELQAEMDVKFTGISEIMWPLGKEFVITAPFGNRLHPILKTYTYHGGVDLAYEGIDKDPVLACSNGIIEEVGFDSDDGNYILIKHPDDETGDIYYSYYAHLSEIEVKEGYVVKIGAEIGKVGKTGKATGAFLHFELRDAEQNSFDPMSVLDL